MVMKSVGPRRLVEGKQFAEILSKDEPSPFGQSAGEVEGHRRE
jgi:hypothetical protein